MEREAACAVINELFEGWFTALVRYAWRATGDRGLAEEMAQDALMLLYRNLRRGKQVHHPKAWMLAVVRRAVARHYETSRKDSVTWETLEVLEGLSVGRIPPHEFGVEAPELHKIFALLSNRELEVVLLRMESFKYREIGKQLGISAKTVSALISRALAKLRCTVLKDGSGEARTTYVAKNIPKTLQ